MRAFSQLYAANVREWRRDPTALLWSMMFPVVIALVVGLVFSSSGKMFFRIGMVNEAGADGQRFITAFEGNPAFQISTGTRQSELDALQHGRRDALVILPPALTTALATYDRPLTDAAQQVPLDVRYDSGTPNGPAAADLIQQTLAVVEAQITGTLPLLTVTTEAMTVQRLRTADYMLPGVLALSLLLLGLYVTAIPLVSLREKAVLRRMGCTPLTRVMLLASQFAFRLTVALVQALVIIAISVLVFDLPLHARDLPATTGIVVLGAAVFIAFGYLLAAVARSEEAAQVLAGLPFLVFGLLSGVLIPYWRIPAPVQRVMDVIPLTYLADALRQVMTGANGRYSMTTNVMMLGMWLVICTLLAIRLFRWQPMT